MNVVKEKSLIEFSSQIEKVSHPVKRANAAMIPSKINNFIFILDGIVIPARIIENLITGFLNPSQ